MAIQPDKAKKLSELAQKTFDQFVGNPPNWNFPYNSREEILFTFNILESMIHGYTNHMVDKNIKLLASSSCYQFCSRCGNEEIGKHDKFCKICGLPIFSEKY